MSISAIGGATASAIKRTLSEVGVDVSDDQVKIGTEDAGLIVHFGPGETLEGTEVEESDWIEIYGNEVHFSRTVS